MDDKWQIVVNLRDAAVRLLQGGDEYREHLDQLAEAVSDFDSEFWDEEDRWVKCLPGRKKVRQN